MKNIKNYKKSNKQASPFLALILTCAMVLLLLSGCGSRKIKVNADGDSTNDVTSSATDDSAATGDIDDENTNDITNDITSDGNNDGTTSGPEQNTTVEGQGSSDAQGNTKPGDSTTKPSNEAGTTADTSGKPTPTTTKPTQPVPTTTKPTQQQVPTTTKPQPTQPQPTTTQPQPMPTTSATATAAKNKVDAVADDIISGNIKKSMTTAEKVKVIHDYLVRTVDYDVKGYAKFQQTGDYSVFDQSVFTAEGALINKLAVCEGYSESFKLLMDKLSIKCAIVYGTGNGGAHAWNMVEIDGYWYYVDVTFDDPIMNGQVVPNGENITYENFLVPNRIISKAHVIDKSQTVRRNSILNSYPTNDNSDKYLDYVMMWEEVNTKEEYKSTLLSYLNKGVYRVRVVVPGSWDFEWDTIREVTNEYYNKTNIWIGRYSYSESVLGDIKIWIIEFTKN